MQTQNRFLDDLAKLLNGAAGVAASVRDEAGAQVRHRLERWFAGLDFVPREEFEAVKEMAARARGEQERLAARLDRLEARLAKKPGAAPKRPSRAKKPATGRRR